MADPISPYNVADLADDVRRVAPAAARNVAAIGNALADWLPVTGLILEIASGTGEHALAFAKRFPNLDWQPSDPDPVARASIAAWQGEGSPNLLGPLRIDAAAPDWPIDRAGAILCVKMLNTVVVPQKTKEFAAVLCINMVHISPWAASLGLLDGSAKLLGEGGPLILYGPWLRAGVPTAPSNLAFDQSLKERDPEWGLRSVEVFEAEALKRGFMLEEVRDMPANNLMLLFRKVR